MPDVSTPEVTTAPDPGRMPIAQDEPPPATSDTPSPRAVPPLLDGAWLRRERERIAIGRRVVAARLGVSESRVATVETRKHPVPAGWLDGIVSLGFRVPYSDPAAMAKDEHGAPAEQTTLRENALQLGTIPAAAEANPAAAANASAVEFAEAPLLAGANSAPMNPAAPTDASEAAPTTQVEQPMIASLSSAVPGREIQTPPVPDLPRGGWLKARRYALNLSLREVATALRVSRHDLSILEANNLVIPPPWMSILGALHFYDASAGTRATRDQQVPALHGAWLREQRNKKRISSLVLSKHLHIRSSLVVLVEVRDWPVPPEWLPMLAALGLPVPSELLTWTQHGTAQAPHLSGAWLRVHRQRKGITQLRLCRSLKVLPPVLSRCERQDWPLPPKWLPVLRRLGFPVPTDLRSRAVEKPKEQSTRTATPPSNSHPSSIALASLTGHELRQERGRLQISQKKLSQHLRIGQPLLCEHELQNRPVPASWLPVLLKLGFRPLSERPSEGLSSEMLTGSWLRQHRKCLKRTLSYVSKRIQVRVEALQSAERHNEPLPLGWLPGLHKLGFPVPESLQGLQQSQGSPQPDPPEVKAARQGEGPMPSARRALRQRRGSLHEDRAGKEVEPAERGRLRHTIRLEPKVEQKLQTVAEILGIDLNAAISICVSVHHYWLTKPS